VGVAVLCSRHRATGKTTVLASSDDGS